MKKTSILGTICASAMLMFAGSALAHDMAKVVPCDSNNVIFPAGGCDSHPHYYSHPGNGPHSHAGILQLTPQEAAVRAVPVVLVDAPKPAPEAAPAAAAPAAPAEPAKVAAPAVKSDKTKPDGKKAAKKAAKKANKPAAEKKAAKPAAEKKAAKPAAEKKAAKPAAEKKDAAKPAQ
ncbi:MAG: hypothetical protein HQL77_08085 [Magnetococcales bacterium]|nr:hypothetical protein [Magnetococcales bacterium]